MTQASPENQFSLNDYLQMFLNITWYLDPNKDKFHSLAKYLLPIYLLGFLIVPSFRTFHFVTISLWVFSHLSLNKIKFTTRHKYIWAHMALAMTIAAFLCRLDTQFALTIPLLIFLIPSTIFYVTQSKMEAIAAYTAQLALNKFYFDQNFVKALGEVIDFSLHKDLCAWITLMSFMALLLSFSYRPVFLPSQQPAQEDKEANVNINLCQRLQEAEQVIRDLKRIIGDKNDSLLTVSHECRNPLNGIQSNLELAEAALSVQSGLSEHEVQKFKGFLHNAKICGEVLLHYINNILDSAKMESDKIDINPTSTDIRTTLEKVWVICSESIKRKGLIGSLTLDRRVPLHLQLDSHRLIQVMLNLINNSIKFTKRGAITIKVGWKEPEDLTDGLSPETRTPKNIRASKKTLSVFMPTSTRKYTDDFSIDSAHESSTPTSILNQRSRTLNVCVMKQKLEYNYTLDFENKQFRVPDFDPEYLGRYEDREGTLIITIMDTGCGISEENLPKLFQKFSQVNKDPAKRKIGTGLGLWLCKHICEGMGGSIEAHSREDFGSSFNIIIPIRTCENMSPATSENFSDTATTRLPRSGLLNVNAQGKINMKAIVIGNDNYSRSIHKTFLEKCGCEVVIETNDEIVAYESFKRHAGRIDIVLVDLDMPRIGDMGICHLIRDYENKNKLEPSLVLLIGTDTTRNRRRHSFEVHTQACYDQFIKMPCSFDNIKEAVEKTVSIKASRTLSKVSVKKKKVLVIDDDGFCLEIAKNFFQSAGIECVQASGCDEGLNILQKSYNDIGCVLVDFEMPDKNGRETMLLIKDYFKKNTRRIVPVYCCTGNVTLSFKDEMLRAGFDGVYGKPLNWKKILLDIEKRL